MSDAAGKRRKRELWGPLLAVLAGAAVLRLVRLGSIPPALFRDEAEKAYTAWSILKTGRDLGGHFIPLFINAFGVTTSAIYQYAAIPFQLLLGLNEWSTRLPAAVVGIATVGVNHKVMKLERGHKQAGWAALFLALSPWHVLFSRWAQQGVFLPLLLSVAMLGWQWFRMGRKIGLPVTAGTLAIAIYAYDVARLFVPLLSLWVISLHYSDLLKRRKETLVAAGVFLVLVAPVVWLVTIRSDAAQARFQAITIIEPGVGLGRIAIRFLQNYGAHWSPSFLVLHGDEELRHSVGTGLLTGAEAVCVLAGLVVMARRRTKSDLIWIGWLLLFPVAASLTKVGIPHALRCIVALPAMQNVAAIGAVGMISGASASRRRLIETGLLLAQLITTVPFIFRLFGPYATQSAINWQYGVKEALDALHDGMNKDDRVVVYGITGGELLVAFYEKIPPQQVQKSGLRDTRFTVVPFTVPIQSVYQSTASKPTAYITLPVFPMPPGGIGIPIYAPGEARSPAAVIYANAKLGERLRADGMQ